MLAFIAIAINSSSQAPQGFNYQAILRNSDGTIKTNETVAIQVSIVHGYTDGAPVYMEIHNTTTSEFGMVNLVIGEGESSDELSLVDWANGPYFLEINMNGVALGSSPLLSVPYALYAQKSGINFSGDYNDLNNIPLEFTPENHAHSQSDIVDLYHYSDNDIDGNELAFDGWDKNGDDDFSGDMKNKKILNVADPVEAQDAATKAYVDDLKLQVQYLQNALLKELGEIWLNDSLGIFLDPRDNTQYTFITIGRQVWMAENLAYLPNISPSAEMSASEQHQYVYDYEGTIVSEAKNTYNYQTYGVLYNWPASIAACPDGWYLPSDVEWGELELFIGMEQSFIDITGWRGTDEGDKIKDQTGWSLENDILKNEFGFSALPGGGLWSYFGEYGGTDTDPDRSAATWWSSTETNSEKAFNRLVDTQNSQDGIFRYVDWKRMGYSVRCIKD